MQRWLDGCGAMLGLRIGFLQRNLVFGHIYCGNP